MTEEPADIALPGPPGPPGPAGPLTPPGRLGGEPERRWGGPAGALLRACHPGPTVAVTLLVAGLAMAAGQNGRGTALATAAVVTGQLSVGWSNDAVDAARDGAAGRGDKPVAGGAVGAGTVRVAALVALALCVPLSLGYGAAAGTVHLLGVAAGWAYNLGLKATVVSWLPYAVGFGALPAFVTLGLPGHPPPVWWMVAAAALVGVGAHLGDVLPDIADDLAAGVRGAPQRLGPTAVRWLLPAPLVAATALLTLGRPGPAAALALTAAVGAALAGAVLGAARPKAPFLAAVAVAAVDVALLLWRGAAQG
ncbi:UbiA family prenyltransferase [Streptomyces sp. NPDC093085]|uniref:UbiA family prenyltransferase n=1 Tax=Streptomyces sp. NPDC093085 TaxID=3155068 RepID=UPI00343B9F00